MPLFYTPKPRQFHYQPRFYDPEKERWEALKMKYRIEHQDSPVDSESTGSLDSPSGSNDAELAYFQQRLREMERKKHHQELTWKDMFRKREMPKFNYQPRFSTDMPEAAGETPENATERVQHYKMEHTKIKRRFDFHSTFDRKQRKPWIIVAAVFVGFYLCYRYYGAVVQFLYDLFF